MDGRADSLTFVGTAADDVDLETGIEEFQLVAGSSIKQVVSARNLAVRDVVMSQLDDISFHLGELAGEQRITAAKLAQRLKASKIFTVSAREFLRINGLSKTNASGLDDVCQTEVPALIDHMRQICFGYGVTAHHEALQRQYESLLDEIKQEIRSQQAMLSSRAEVSQRGLEEMRAAIEAARSFLQRDLGDSRASGPVSGSGSVATGGTSETSRRARKTRSRLDGHRVAPMHWATIKAVCRRGGTHVGANGRSDFPADLSKPILDGIAFAWSDFFGERLSQTLEKSTSRLLHNAETYRGGVAKSVSSSAGRLIGTS